MGLLDTATLGLASVGTDVEIYELTRFTGSERIAIGSNVIVDDFVFLQGGNGLVIGSFVHIASFAGITGGGVAKIGDFCTISSGARILTGTDVVDGSGLVNSTIPAELRSVERSETTLEAHSFVGANSVVHPGVRLGEGAVVGSGSVVLEDLEPWTINVGSPTRVVRRRPAELIVERAARLGVPRHPDRGPSREADRPSST